MLESLLELLEGYGLLLALPGHFLVNEVDLLLLLLLEFLPDFRIHFELFDVEADVGGKLLVPNFDLLEFWINRVIDEKISNERISRTFF